MICLTNKFLIGVVARPVGGDFPSSDIQYQTLRLNVDLLKLIQLGLSFTDKDGNLADGCTCWQFNFKFSLTDDMFAQDSIDLLKLSGIDFMKFENYGIDIHYFGELLMMSGLVLSEEVKWVSFHSSYDFGYLLKTLTCRELPLDESDFLSLLHLYFPCLYDVKYMMTSVEGMYGGLSSLADTLQVDRIGPMHQAGSDSLLTAQTYFMLLKKHSSNVGDQSKFRGELFGLGSNHTKYKPKRESYRSSLGGASTTNGDHSSNTDSNSGRSSIRSGSDGWQSDKHSSSSLTVSAQIQYSHSTHFPPSFQKNSGAVINMYGQYDDSDM